MNRRRIRIPLLLCALVLQFAAFGPFLSSLGFGTQTAEAGDCSLNHSATWYFSADGRVYIRTNHSASCGSGMFYVYGRNVVNQAPGGACTGPNRSAGGTSPCSTPYIGYPSNRQNYVTAYTYAYKYDTVKKAWVLHQTRICNYIVDRPGTSAPLTPQTRQISQSCR